MMVEYYSMDAGNNCTEEAKNIYRLCAAVGMRTLIQQSLGWQPKEKEVPRQLPNAVEYINAAKDLNSLKGEMPAAIIQLLLDKLGDELCGQKQLPSDQHRLVGCAQKAEELGFKVTEKNRGSLGKFVKSQGLKSIPQEERLVNGQLRKVNMYEDCVELEEAISAFFR